VESYRIELKKSAEEDLDEIAQKFVYWILEAMGSLGNSPSPHGVRIGNFRLS